MNNQSQFLKFSLAFVLSMSITALVCWQAPHLIKTAFNLDDVYLKANWNYDPIETKFDDTPWTYVTDYLLAALTGGCGISMLRSCEPSPLRTRAVALMFCYTISTTMGGLCHHFSTPFYIQFPVLWSVVVGSVTFGGGIIGSIGTALNEIIIKSRPPSSNRFRVVTIPEWCWLLWSVTLTVFVCIG
jgi:hypothetical protein